MKLRELPELSGYMDAYTVEQVRAIQLEAARDALEAAAKAMDISGSTVWGVVAGDQIRAIPLEQP